jgi:hypothetical protein
VRQAFNKKEVALVKNTLREIHHFIKPFDEWLKEYYYVNGSNQPLDSSTVIINMDKEIPNDQ